MSRWSRREFLTSSALLGLAAGCEGPGSLGPSASPDDSALQCFLRPPDDCRMLVYWWWFGPSQTEAQVSLELEAMKKAGIGGAFVFPVYPLSPEETENYPYLSPRFLELLRFTARRAKELSLSMDLLLGGGWPFGGPGVSLEKSSRTILRVPRDRALKPGEVVVAVDERSGMAFVSAPTLQKIKAGAVGSEGWVLDHLDRAEVERYLERVAAPQVAAVPPGSLRSINFDSLEAFGQSWTPAFLDEFRHRRGYDLGPHLASLWEDRGEETPHVRHDYWRTVADLALDHFIRPLQRWSRAHGVTLQGKPMGQPVMDLRCHGELDLTMSEEYDWLEFSGPRWAASGAHVYGRNLVANEGYTWLRMPRYLETLEDVKVGSDVQFLAGINVIVGHGFSYSPESTGVPGWSYYAGVFFHPKNPWWPYLPHLADYVQRVSYILRQGVPVADIALVLPEDDVMARAPADRLMGTQKVLVKTALADGVDVPQFGLEGALRARSTLVSSIVTNGYSFDGINSDALLRARIDQGRLSVGQGTYGVLILPAIEGMPVEALKKIAEFARSGGHVLAVERVPALAYGLPDAASSRQAVQRLSDELFGDRGSGCRVADRKNSLVKALRDRVPPDLDLKPADADVGFVHRRAGSEDFYFIANTSATPKTFQATFRVGHRRPQRCDPMDGRVHPFPEYSFEAGGTRLPLALGPRESLIVAFGASTQPCPPPRTAGRRPALPSPIRVEGPWRLSISEKHVNLDRLRSWTDFEDLRAFSGTAVYATRFDLPKSFIEGDHRVICSLGELHEIAEVFVNGQPAGVCWMSPRQVELSGRVREGSNELVIKVTNLLINRVLGQPDPDVARLVAKYGYLFPGGDLKPAQNNEKKRVKEPLPSGLLGPVEIRAEAAAE